MSNVRTASGLIVPSSAVGERGIRCQQGYKGKQCENIIWPSAEVNGRLWLVNGRPACGRCRVLAVSPSAKRILADKDRYQKDLELKEKIAQQKADDHVRAVAAASQEGNSRITQ